MDLFDLYAKITLDSTDYEQGIKQAESSGNDFSGTLSGKMTSAANAATKALKALAAAASVKVLADFAKQAVEAYANYEQLAGGIETLFKGSSDKVQEYANNAYKTAGLSANEYMETVTSFSASLLQSLGNDTEAAAEKADMAITDMADNANKMGTSMESIQNAYQGFAKQNYTMLDNLKLGYGGTKEEMERLLEDAEQLQAAQGVLVDYSIDSYADIVDAIHVVQTEMGITGTTAQEAATTIEGSMNAAKSAVENLMVGIADGTQDLVPLVTNVVDSVATAAGNIIPRVEQVLESVGNLLVDYADDVVNIAADIISDFCDYIGSHVGDVLDAGADMLLNFTQGIVDNLPSVIDSAVNAIASFVVGIADHLDEIVAIGGNIVTALVEGIVALISKLPEVTVTLIQSMIKTWQDNQSNWSKIGQNLVNGISEGVKNAATGLLTNIKQLMSNCLDVAQKMLSGQAVYVSDFTKGLTSTTQQAITVVGSASREAANESQKAWQQADDAIADKAEANALVMSNAAKETAEANTTAAASVVTAANSAASSVKKAATTATKAVESVAQTAKDVADTIAAAYDGIIDQVDQTVRILELESELWDATYGSTADASEIAERAIEELNTKIAAQEQVVEAARAKYQEMLDTFGETSSYTMDAQEALLEEEIELQNLRNEAEETTNTINTTLDALSEAVSGTGSSLTSLGGIFEDVGETLDNTFLSSIGTLLSTLGSGISTIVNFASSVSSLGTSLSSLGSTASSVFSAISGILGSSSGGGVLTTLVGALGSGGVGSSVISAVAGSSGLAAVGTALASAFPVVAGIAAVGGLIYLIYKALRGGKSSSVSSTSSVSDASSSTSTADADSSGTATVSVTQNIYSEAQTAADLMREARWNQERVVLMS